MYEGVTDGILELTFLCIEICLVVKGLDVERRLAARANKVEG